MPLACPRCGSRNLRPAQYKNADERINALRFISPLRCKDCRTRFVSKTIFLSDLFYARCPKCDRMDLNRWTGKTYQPTGWTAVKVALGAFKWRCEYCRINFASFRKRRELFAFSRWKNRNPDLVAEKPVENIAAETTPQQIPGTSQGRDGGLGEGQDQKNVQGSRYDSATRLHADVRFATRCSG